MKIGHRGDVASTFRTLFEAGAIAGLTDAELLERSSSGRGPQAELAFAALVERHGPMVLRVCRKALGDPDDAHDAFQSTFFVLARKADTIRDRRRFRRKVVVITSQARATAWVLGVIPVALALFTIFTQPALRDAEFGSAIGRGILFTAMAFDAGAVFFLIRLTKLDA